jgi:hypothetical protein
VSDDEETPDFGIWMTVGPWIAPPDEARRQIERGFESVGLEPLEEPLDDDDLEQVTCRLVHNRFEDLWLSLEPKAIHPDLVMQALTESAEDDLTFHIVRTFDGTSGFETSTRAYDLEAQTVKAGPDGEREVLDFAGSVNPDSIPKLDRVALAKLLVERAINEGNVEDLEQVDEFFVQSYGQDDDLDTRVADIAADVRHSAGFTIEEMAGQQCIRIELPDGTSRMSAISDEEIETITERTTVEPGE